MRWFKHDAQARNDRKIRQIQREFGLEAVGFWWTCLEIIASEGQDGKILFQNYSKENIASDMGISLETFDKLLKGCFKARLLQEAKDGFCCANFIKRADDYTKRVRRVSEQCSDNVHPEQEQDKDKNKKQKKETNIYTPEFEQFWAIYPRKEVKGKAYKCWNARTKEGVDIETLLLCSKNYSELCAKEGKETKYIKLPATFLSKDHDFETYKEAVKKNNLPAINRSEYKTMGVAKNAE